MKTINVKIGDSGYGFFVLSRRRDDGDSIW